MPDFEVSSPQVRQVALGPSHLQRVSQLTMGGVVRVDWNIRTIMRVVEEGKLRTWMLHYSI